MGLSTERCVDLIGDGAESLAALAAGHFDVDVDGCPGWRVRDVLQHLVEVYWFWSTIVEGRLESAPETGRPDAPGDDHLVSAVLLGARRLTDALESADQSASVYTWAPAQHDVAFVTRHQVQETLVHGHDVAVAVGQAWPIPTDAAVDGVEEFLTFSLSTAMDPAEPARAPLDGVLELRCVDAGVTFTVEDDVAPGTLRVEPGTRDDAVVLSGDAADVLLWLYGRTRLPGEADHAALVERFRHLTFTT
ncbi:MAG: maleylpyruvate isomerase family mycothiol-dependent enzyme [Acidimicrobiales bacterium]